MGIARKLGRSIAQVPARSPRAPASGAPAGVARELLALFAKGEHGAAYYFTHDFAGLYQDALGTAPVTAVEQPVGLMLDRRFGLARGPELVVNGDFANGLTGWSPSAITSYDASSVFEVTPDGWIRAGVPDGTSAYASLSPVAPMVVKPETYYEATFKIRNAGNRVDFRLGPSLGSGSYVSKSNVNTQGDWRFVFKTGSTTGLYLQWIINSASPTAEFDGVSIRELPGNHASQATTTARPVLSARVNLFPRSDVILWANKTNVSVEPQAVYREDSNSWMLRMLETDAAGSHNTNSDSGGKVPFVAGAAVTVSATVKSIGGRNFRIGGPSGALIPLAAIFDLNQGTVQSAIDGSTAKIEALKDGYFRCSVTATCLGTQSSYVVFNSVDGSSLSFAGDPAKGLLIGAVDFRHESKYLLPPYQRVTSATDYDWRNFPLYLSLDGADDLLQFPAPLGVDVLFAAALSVHDSATTTEIVLGSAAPETYFSRAANSNRMHHSYRDGADAQATTSSTTAVQLIGTGVFRWTRETNGQNVAIRFASGGTEEVLDHAAGAIPSVGPIQFTIGRRAAGSNQMRPFRMYGMVLRMAKTPIDTAKAVDRMLGKLVR